MKYFKHKQLQQTQMSHNFYLVPLNYNILPQFGQNFFKDIIYLREREQVGRGTVAEGEAGRSRAPAQRGAQYGA